MIMSTSHARLVPPRAKYEDRVSMQVPGMLGSHCFATGLHAKDSRKVNMSWLMVTSAMTMYSMMA